MERSLQAGISASLEALRAPVRMERVRVAKESQVECLELARQFAVGDLVSTADGDATVEKIDLATGSLCLRFLKPRRGKRGLQKYSPRVVVKK